MQRTFATNGYTIRESRLCAYNWNTQRLIEEGRVYANDIKNPVDTVLHAGAGVTHAITGITDAIFGDAIRVLQGPESRIPLNRYEGALPRLSLDGSEAWQAMRNVFRGRLLSVLSLPVIVFKAAGDAVADGVDAFAGVKHGNSYSMSA